MRGTAFRGCGVAENILLGQFDRYDFLYFEDALGERAGLVTGQRGGVGEELQVASALHENAGAGRTADPSEK